MTGCWWIVRWVHCRQTAARVIFLSTRFITWFVVLFANAANCTGGRIAVKCTQRLTFPIKSICLFKTVCVWSFLFCFFPTLQRIALCVSYCHSINRLVWIETHAVILRKQAHTRQTGYGRRLRRSSCWSTRPTSYSEMFVADKLHEKDAKLTTHVDFLSHYDRQQQQLHVVLVQQRQVFLRRIQPRFLLFQQN